MKGRLCVMLTLLVALAMLLSGCAKPTPTPVPRTKAPAAPTKAVEPTPKPVTITFWYAIGGKNGEALMRLVDDFMKEYPYITVEATYTGSYAETGPKMIAAMAANTLPNGGVIPGGFFYTGREGNFLVEDYIKGPNGLDMDDFWPVLRKLSSLKGRICCLPFNNSTLVFFYNKDLMRKAGLDPEKPPQTWDELKSMAKEIVEKAQGEARVWGVDTKGPHWTLMYLIHGAGGRLMNDDATEPEFASEAGYKAMTFWKSLVDEGSMPAAQHKGSTELFLAGNLGFWFASTGNVGRVRLAEPDFDWGTAFFPKKERYGGPPGGANLCLFPSDKAKEDATWTLLRWLLSPKNCVRWTIETGYVPVRRSALEDPEMQTLFEEMPEYRAGFEQLEYAVQGENFEQSGTMQNLFDEALNKVELGAMGPKEALDEADEKLRAEMAR